MASKSLPLYPTELSDDLTYPARSQLYALAPIGVGTSAVESLTSYLTRLAHAHGVTADRLASSQLAPLMDRSDWRAKDKFAHCANNLNGVNLWTGLTLGALEQLTLRNDLSFLTLYPWRQVLASRKLLHSCQAWCPACFQEWRQAGQEPYVPLLWTLEAVQICLRHQHALSHQCPYADCRQPLPLLSRRVKVGYCPTCHRWLGSETVPSSREAWPEDEWQWQCWIAAQLGELLAAAPRLSTLPTRQTLGHNLRLCLRSSSQPSLRGMTRRAGLALEPLMRWLHGTHRPQVSLLLQYCFRQKWPLLDLLMPRPDADAGQDSRAATSIKRVDGAQLRHQLEALLADNQHPPDSVEQVAQQLGVDASSLAWHCPDLYQQLVERHTQAQRARSQARNAVLERGLKACLESAETPPPTCFEVARRLQCPPGTLWGIFPDLCRALADKRKAFQQARRLRAEAALRKALAIEITSRPSPRAIATELNEPLHYLYQHFPELYRAVADRKGHRSPSTSEPPASPRPRAQSSIPRRPSPASGSSAPDTGAGVLPPVADSQETKAKHEDRQAQKADRELKLRAILAAKEEPPPTVLQVAQRLGVPLTTLRKQCPGSCAALVRQQQDYQQALKHQHQVFLEQLVAENPVPPPSLKEVARRLGGQTCPASLKYQFPEASQIIVARYEAYPEQASQTARAALEAALSTEAALPPTPSQVARQLGHPSRRYLQAHFPDLCHQLVQARTAYRRRTLRAEVEALILWEPVDPPLSLLAICRKLKCDYERLKEACPELAQEITAQRRSDLEAKKLVIQQTLEAALADDRTPPVSFNTIMQRFGNSYRTLYRWFPELIRQVIEKQKAYQRERSRLYRQHD